MQKTEFTQLYGAFYLQGSDANTLTLKPVRVYTLTMTGKEYRFVNGSSIEELSRKIDHADRLVGVNTEGIVFVQFYQPRLKSLAEKRCKRIPNLLPNKSKSWTY